MYPSMFEISTTDHLQQDKWTLLEVHIVLDDRSVYQSWNQTLQAGEACRKQAKAMLANFKSEDIAMQDQMMDLQTVQRWPETPEWM